MKKNITLLALVIISSMFLAGCWHKDEQKNDNNTNIMYNDSGVVDKANQPEESSYIEVSSGDDLSEIEDDLKNTSINDVDTSDLETIE